VNQILVNQRPRVEAREADPQLAEVWQPEASGFSEADLYRTPSKSASVSLLIGLMAMLGYLFMVFMILAPAAIAFGWYSRTLIGRYPREYSGRGLATTGLLLGCLSLFGGAGYHTAIYMTEVREGYQRITFSGDLKNKVDQPTARAWELDGQPVFVKGYVRPGLRSRGLTEFLLVGDFGDCCFGGSPNISEIVYVKMPEGQTARYDWRLRRIHGTFRVNQRLQKGERIADDIKGYVYEIKADYFD